MLLIRETIPVPAILPIQAGGGSSFLVDCPEWFQFCPRPYSHVTPVSIGRVGCKAFFAYRNFVQASNGCLGLFVRYVTVCQRDVRLDYLRSCERAPTSCRGDPVSFFRMCGGLPSMGMRCGLRFDYVFFPLSLLSWVGEGGRGGGVEVDFR